MGCSGMVTLYVFLLSSPGLLSLSLLSLLSSHLTFSVLLFCFFLSHTSLHLSAVLSSLLIDHPFATRIKAIYQDVLPSAFKSLLVCVCVNTAVLSP